MREDKGGQGITGMEYAMICVTRSGFEIAAPGK